MDSGDHRESFHIKSIFPRTSISAGFYYFMKLRAHKKLEAVATSLDDSLYLWAKGAWNAVIVRLLIELIDTCGRKFSKTSVWEFVTQAKVRQDVPSSLNCRSVGFSALLLTVVMRYGKHFLRPQKTLKEDKHKLWGESKSSEGHHHQGVRLCSKKTSGEADQLLAHMPQVLPVSYGVHSLSWSHRCENDNVKVLQLKSSKSNTLWGNYKHIRDKILKHENRRTPAEGQEQHAGSTLAGRTVARTRTLPWRSKVGGVLNWWNAPTPNFLHSAELTCSNLKFASPLFGFQALQGFGVELVASTSLPSSTQPLA